MQTIRASFGVKCSSLRLQIFSSTSLQAQIPQTDLKDVSEDTYLLQLHGAVLAHLAAPGDEKDSSLLTSHL